MNVRCTNESGGTQHRHVHLEQGRAKLAQVYPRQFCIRICEGIAAQKRKEVLGVQSRPLMSVEEMRKAVDKAGVRHADGCPSAALHEDDGENWVAVDDVTGQRFDPTLMRRACRDEIAYLKEMGVDKKVDLEETRRETDKAPHSRALGGYQQGRQR